MQIYLKGDVGLTFGTVLHSLQVIWWNL